MNRGRIALRQAPVTSADYFSLAAWRREVAGLYANIRATPRAQRAGAVQAFRAARDVLFKTHPHTPLAAAQQTNFKGLRYYPYDPAWRLLGSVSLDGDDELHEVDLGAEGALRFTRVGRVHFSANAQAVMLAVYWLKGYGGGLWLPFRDATNGNTTYGGGRYLYDTIKGADLGTENGELVLDFNYAYNPSCAYDNRWLCPLSPGENTLCFEVGAGERLSG